MGHLDHATFGWLTPVLSYAMAAIGAALALRCTVRALGASGRSRRNWLITAASASAPVSGRCTSSRCSASASPAPKSATTCH